MTTPAPAAQRVYDLIRREIMTGELAGGVLLSEVEVGARVGVSRTPVHEAFRKLEAEELLELAPRRGAIVVPVRPGEAVDILETRHALEVAAVRRLARGSAELRQTFAQTALGLLADQQRLAADGNLVAYAAADAAFHRAIVTVSGNRTADRFYASLAERMQRMTIGSVTGRIDYLAVLTEEHGQLAGLVENANVAEFDALLARHFAATHQAVIGPIDLGANS